MSFRITDNFEVESHAYSDIDRTEPSTRRSIAWRVALLVILSTVAGSLLVLTRHDSVGLESSQAESLLKSSELRWTLQRVGYEPIQAYSEHKSNTIFKYSFMSDIDAVAEPHAEMQLYVYNVNTDNAGIWDFEMCNKDGVCATAMMETKDGATIRTSATANCEPGEDLNITVNKYNSKGDAVVKTATGTAKCMYVRREIRALTESDLERTMDSMYTLWSTEEEAGQALYGDNFHNITYLLQMHHFNAAWPDADHFHEGNGFLIQHLKMTNIFEKAMLAVDKTVPLPYWDFTIEETEGLSCNESPILSTSMFGATHPATNSTIGYRYDQNQILDFAILSGRWAYAKAEFNPEKFADLEAGYGYMRSPWNMNPSPYITRFTGTLFLPNCKSHYDMLYYSDMMDFFFEMESSPHATSHGGLGGAFGCDLFLPLLEEGYINDEASVKAMCKTWIFTLKALYRKNYIAPQKSCALGDSVQDATCPFECLQDGEVLRKQLLDNYLRQYVPSDMSQKGKKAWEEFICGGDASRVFAGDHSESASPSDPSFWPIHPTLERLFHAKMMAGGFISTDWATSEEAENVCIRYQCYEDGEYGAHDECCYGHYEGDQMYDFISADRNSKFGPTNAEVLAMSDPTSGNYAMPYIYDNFLWDHCDQQDFDEAFLSLAKSDGMELSGTSTSDVRGQTRTRSRRKQ